MNFQDEVIDLTNSFTLGIHDNLSNSVIDLDAYIFNQFDVNQINNRRNSPADIQHNQKRKIGAKERKTFDATINKEDDKKATGCAECPICWDVLGTRPLASTKCGHVYCLKCLERSLKIEKRCPTCRSYLRGSNSYHPLYLNFK